jgi:hypothetical protein
LENTDCYRIIKKFISEEESIKIVNWVDSLNHTGDDINYHLSELSKDLKGKSCIFDISNTHLTNYITKFQSITDVSKEELPLFIYDIIERISKEFNFSKDNIFLQAVDMRKGGKINPHYDAAIDGYISYKCNISVLSDDYELFIGNESINVNERDLYCFEASLYKHWANEFASRRVLLSFGFILPYSTLNRTENDHRVRLSRRIEKYFQSEINNNRESTKE